MKFSKKMLQVVLMLAMGAGYALAQGTDLGTVRGVVTDTTGALVPNATVTVTDNLTGTSRNARSNSKGEWQVFGVTAGTYTVQVTAAGMTTRKITGVVVHGSDTVSADAALGASSTASVEVTADRAPTINTEDQTISQTIDSHAIIDLPRDSRDVYSFLYLNPSITQADVNGDFKFIGAQSYGASFSLDGQRSNGGLFGQPTDSEPSLEAVGDLNVLTNDFTAEYAGIANIRITTKRGGDQYHGSIFYNNKNSALAAWQIQDKAALAAFVPLLPGDHFGKPYFNLNDLGASIGGPLPKLKKTFFFMAYERNYSTTPTEIQSSKLPHPSLYTGDFSLMNDSAKPHVPSNIVLTPEEIEEDTVGGLGQQFIRIPQRLLDPVTQTIVKNYFPKLSTALPINANTGVVSPQYYSTLSTPSTIDRGTLRVDHDFSDRDHAYVAYNVSAQTKLTGALLTSPYAGFGEPLEQRQNNTVSISYTHTFSSNIVNEARGGFNRESLYEHSAQKLNQYLSGIGFSSSDISTYGGVVGQNVLDTYGWMAVTFSGTKYTGIGTGGRNTDRPMNQGLFTFGDTLTWVVGRHSLRIGGDVVRNAFVDGFAVNRGNVRGNLTYKGIGNFPQEGQKASAADPFSNFLLGEAGFSFGSVLEARPPMNAHNFEQGYFVQDAWKVSQNLTLNIGLRYDLFTPFVENNDLLANFDPNASNSNGNKGVFILPSSRTLKYIDPRIVNYGYVMAGSEGLGRGLTHTDPTDLGPRFGLAWRITPRDVLRGGYGVFYPTSAAQLVRDPIGTNPFNQAVTSTWNASSPLQSWQGFAGTGGGGNPAVGGVASNLQQNQLGTNIVDINVKQPRIQQWNVTFERQIGQDLALRASYIGSHMGGLIAGNDLNEIPANDTPFGVTDGNGNICDPEGNTDYSCDYSAADRARMPFPNLSDFLYDYHNYGHGMTNALQFTAEKQLRHGLEFMLSYTYLDQRSTGMDTGNSSLGGVAYDIFSPNSDYGTDSYVSHNRVVGYGVWNVPVGRGNHFGSNMPKWLDFVVGGWQSSFNFFAKSGTSFTPYWICDDCDPVSPGNIAVGSTDATGDFNYEPSYRPTAVNTGWNRHVNGSYFDASSFGLPTLGSTMFSTAVKRNVLQGPGAWGANLGVHKDFSITERVKLQLGADVDNVFNHPLRSPDAGDAADNEFAALGEFNMTVDQTTGALGIDPSPDYYFPNDVADGGTFGLLNNSYPQEGVDSRRSIRLRGRITF